MKLKEKLVLTVLILSCFSYGLKAEASEITTEASVIENQNEEKTPKLEVDSLKLYVGEKSTIKIVNLETFQNYEIRIPTINNEIINVSSTGEIEALSAGEIEVTVNVIADGISYNLILKVTVSNKDVTEETKIIVDETHKVLVKGESYKINAKLNNDADCEFTYVSSNSKIATVSKDGTVTGIKKGIASIIVSTKDGIQVEIQIEVVNSIGQFQINYIKKDKVEIAVDQSRRLSFNIVPSTSYQGKKENFTWTSSNSNVVEISKDGVITGIKKGTAQITLESSDGYVKPITITVTVRNRSTDTFYSEDNLSIVDVKSSLYTYKKMASDLKQLENAYGDFLKVSVLAKTYDNRNIYCVRLGNENASKKILVQATAHAREYMASQLVMRQIEFYCANYYSGMYKNSYFSEIFDDVAFYIVPMVNPDGVTISQYGPSGIKDASLKKKLLSMKNKYGKKDSSYFKRWKSNARGVDINRNFDAYWDLATNISKHPGQNGYKGKSPVSEIESKTLVNLFNKIKPNVALSYHATGSIIYWDYGQTGELKKESDALLNVVKKLTGYKPVTTKFSKKSAVGFSDWVSNIKKNPALTIEIGVNSCPLPISEFKSIWSKNKFVLVESALLYKE